MNLIIAISGSQGTGKSSILSSAEDFGCYVDRMSVARTVQANLGWDKLSRVEESKEDMMQFQEEVLNVMMARDAAIAATGRLTIVERSPADVFAYASLWCKRAGADAELDDWLNAFGRKCKAHLETYTVVILVPISSEIPFEYDVNRADEESRTYVQDAIFEFVTFAQPRDKDIQFEYLHATDRQMRGQEVATIWIKEQLKYLMS